MCVRARLVASNNDFSLTMSKISLYDSNIIPCVYYGGRGYKACSPCLVRNINFCTIFLVFQMTTLV